LLYAALVEVNQAILAWSFYGFSLWLVAMMQLLLASPG
jgi:hypothetical protein